MYKIRYWNKQFRTCICEDMDSVLDFILDILAQDWPVVEIIEDGETVYHNRAFVDMLI